MQFTTVDSLSGVEAAAWDDLLARCGGNVFLSHAWLSALEATGAVGRRSGWQPFHLLAREAGRLVGALPLYLKHHSYGEYVFDWAWADAYRRHGLDYYPKLVAAVPFTPCPGPRLLALCDEVAEPLIEAALALARELGVSSLHVLFPTREEAARWAAHGLLERQGVQFHWQNRTPSPFRDFDDLLAAMSHDKRKKIRQDRRYVAEAGVRFRVLRGAEITAADWAFFFSCYENTYRAHLSTPYLNVAFFEQIGERCHNAPVLFIGERDGAPICASLTIASGRTLYGRYWGALETVRSLHFEACYYQPIAWAIAQGFTRFEGGAQGIHKLARGLLPVATHSAHWIADARFASAIDEFCARERIGVAHTIDELEEANPFKTAPSAAA